MAEPVASQKILAALLAVAKQVKYVKREKVPSAGTGVLRDVVVSEVRPILLEHGIITVTSQVGVGRVIETPAKSSNGTPLSIYLGSYRTQFICVEDSSMLEVVNEAIGHDYGDKAAGKARTYAEKMNLIGGLFLETGINDEGRLPDAGDTEPAEPAAPEMDAYGQEILLTLVERAKTVAELNEVKKTARKKYVDSKVSSTSKSWVAFNDALSKRAGELE